MFEKLVAIEPVGLIPSAVEELNKYAKEVIMYDDMPSNDDEVVKRIGDADAVFVSHTTQLTANAMSQCPNIKYVGMCCSLYTPESANVDIKYAESKGIVVKGVRDYGDEGVVEYVIYELVRCFHGFGTDKEGNPAKPWDGMAREITGLKAGIVGLGKSGGMIADALKFFGAEISYFSRSEKEDAKQKGYKFMPLQELMAHNEVIVTCLNKNTVLLHAEEFKKFGNRKILFNTGLSPAWDEAPFLKWLEGDNLCFCDTVGALGDEKLLSHPNVRSVNVSTGRTRQAFVRLSEKVLANILEYNRGR
ncbi:MAG TPA: NAD(P)-dependent oxidoreductase [Marinilabiliaceae bacterium]|nr:NAD(P)-dependent oxidoreductase [Marinilabiliaceae bacterium]